uniref:Methyltransferase type 11 domain-containing protein n=1 Tax=Ciona intestinalis TaxID=7719 RepID=H2XKR4_CIOIN
VVINCFFLLLLFYESNSISEKYKKYRPHYPTQLATETLGDLKGKKLNFLLDVGCGGGQTTNIFAPYFHEVLAIDVSENQLKEAKSQNKLAHVTYKQGFAETLPCDDVSADIITAGAALHWFNRPKFYNEQLETKNNSKLENIYRISSNKYLKILDEMPYSKKRRFDNISMERFWSFDDVKGFIQSVDIYDIYMKRKENELHLSYEERKTKLLELDPSEEFVRL